MYVAQGTSSGWNTFAIPSGDNSISWKTVKAPVRRLDDWWNEANKPTCGFVKIDVEGFEMHVLEGGQSFFAHHSREVSFFGLMEFNNAALQLAATSSVQVFDHLVQLGFEVFHLKGASAAPASRADFGPETSENVLIAPAKCDFLARWAAAAKH